MRFEVLGCKVSCNSPLGIEDGSIADEQLTASNEYSQRLSASGCRLNSNRAWVVTQRNQNQWIQVDTGSLRMVTGIVTQGHYRVSQWVTLYKVLCSKDGQEFHTVNAADQVEEFVGNTNRNTPVTNMFNIAVYVRFIRINSTAWVWRIAMRLEILGCNIEVHEPPSYSGSIYAFVETGKGPHDSVLKTHWLRSTSQCAFMCQHIPGCVSFNIAKEAGTDGLFKCLLFDNILTNVELAAKKCEH